MKNLRSFLQKDLAERCLRNPNYSVRAYAKDLLVSPASLSQILNNKRPLTQEMAERICTRLELSPLDRKKLLSNGNHLQDKNIDFLEEDQFKAVSDWYHIAILELTQCEDFQNDSKWIAKRLGIHEALVKDAIERLLRLQILKRHDNQLVKNLSPFLTIFNNSTSTEKRKLQKQFLQKGIEALSSVPYEKRSHKGLTFSVHHKSIEDLKK